MSLLREICDIASGDGDVTTALRKCKILAARLGSAEFAEWINLELDGYPTVQLVPEYRKLTIIYFASFIGVWQVPKQPIPLQIIPEEHREAFQFQVFREGIAKAYSFTREKHGAVIHRPELVPAVHKKLYPTLTCHHVWGEIPPIEFEQLVSAVKNRIVDFSLKIEAENPDAGEAPPNTQPVPLDKVRPLVQYIIHGSVGNIAQNGQYVTQTAHTGVAPAELQEFVNNFAKHLHELNLGADQKRKAEAQLATMSAQLADTPDPVIIAQAGQTLRNITEGAIGSLIATAVQPSVWQGIAHLLSKLG